MARAFCAVPCRFRPPHSFAKAPHQFPVCDYGNANRSRPYVFLNVGCGFFFFLLLVEELLYERRNEVITFVTFRVVRIASRLSDVPMDGPHAKLCHTYYSDHIPCHSPQHLPDHSTIFWRFSNLCGRRAQTRLWRIGQQNSVPCSKNCNSMAFTH